MKRLILAAIALGAALAFAGTVNITDTYVFQALFKPWSRTTAQLAALTPSAWKGYAAYDSTKGALAVSNGTAWVSSGLNELGPVSASFDPGALGSGAANCQDSNPVTVAGAVITDRCSAAANFGIDGGAGMLIDVWLTCNVTGTNTVKGRICTAISDGGSVDLPDANYTYQVFH